MCVRIILLTTFLGLQLAGNNEVGGTRQHAVPLNPYANNVFGFANQLAGSISHNNHFRPPSSPDQNGSPGQHFPTANDYQPPKHNNHNQYRPIQPFEEKPAPLQQVDGSSGTHQDSPQSSLTDDTPLPTWTPDFGNSNTNMDSPNYWNSVEDLMATFSNPLIPKPIVPQPGFDLKGRKVMPKHYHHSGYQSSNYIKDEYTTTHSSHSHHPSGMGNYGSHGSQGSYGSNGMGLGSSYNQGYNLHPGMRKSLDSRDLWQFGIFTEDVGHFRKEFVPSALNKDELSALHDEIHDITQYVQAAHWRLRDLRRTLKNLEEPNGQTNLGGNSYEEQGNGNGPSYGQGYNQGQGQEQGQGFLPGNNQGTGMSNGQGQAQYPGQGYETDFGQGSGYGYNQGSDQNYGQSPGQSHGQGQSQFGPFDPNQLGTGIMSALISTLAPIGFDFNTNRFDNPESYRGRKDVGVPTMPVADPHAYPDSPESAETAALHHEGCED